jgi:hypothetical protein
VKKTALLGVPPLPPAPEALSPPPAAAAWSVSACRRASVCDAAAAVAAEL